VIEDQSPAGLVLALIGVINGDAPGRTAEEILDPDVALYMDSACYRGIDIWYKWIHLLKNCGRIRDLRMTQCDVRCDAGEPVIVHLSARWSGAARSRHAVSTTDGTADYLVQDGRIKTIWTHKSNYEFIFGRWISHPVCFNAFLAWSVLYFALPPRRGKDLFAGFARPEPAPLPRNDPAGGMGRS
jgi:hypothetical protein